MTGFNNSASCYRINTAFTTEYVMCCTIWYHLYNLKNVKNTHGGVLILVKLQADWNFIKINTPPWVFFTLLKLYKWYQIAQRITYVIYDHESRC